MRIGELFSGYGGLGMGVQSVYGGRIVWHSDIDKGACKILAHRYPDVPNLGDVTTVNWSQVEPVDILTGGTPCQDLSHAGRRAGMTEGTRSNLWVAMREAIATIRPSLVVWENVGGALSARADSDVEREPGLLGDRSGRPALRALGRVLGDLASLGYDASWHSLRASDVGAPHGRLRVFVVATDANRSRAGRNSRAVPSSVGQVGRTHFDLPSTVNGGLLPTPRATRGGSNTETVGLLPTPRATDGTKGGPNQRGSSGDLMLPSAVAGLLPTPTTRDYKNAGDPAKTAGRMAERGQPLTKIAVNVLLPTPRVTQPGYADDGRGGRSLDVEARRLLPTPTARDSAASGGSTPSDVTLTDAVVRTNLGEKENPRHAVPAEAGPREDLRDLRQDDGAQEVRQRPAGGQDGVPEASELLSAVRQQSDSGDEGRPALAGSEAQGSGLSGLWHVSQPARSPRGPESSEQRPVEPDDALRELSSETALAGGSAGVDWGPYAAAIHRWELILGRRAPLPTQLSAKGNPQLSPRFVEFLMGLPAGWVTDVPGITRNEALKALGNGVVPQQAAEALRVMAAWEVAA